MAAADKLALHLTNALYANAVATLVAAGKPVAEAQALVCQWAVDFNHWTLTAIADASPWPSPPPLSSTAGPLGVALPGLAGAVGSLLPSLLPAPGK